MDDATTTEIDTLRALLSAAAARFSECGIHEAGCSYYRHDFTGPSAPECDCGLDRLTRACKRASKETT